MNKKAILTPIALLLLLSVFVISSGSKYAAQESLQLTEESYLVPDDDAAKRFPKGAAIYKEKCVICHQANGEGIPGAFPPLKNSDYLFADKVRAVSQVLNGSHEEMVVNGVTYNAPMTPQVDTKEDAVAVINYVLNAWGNDAGTVTMDDVKNVKINPR